MIDSHTVQTLASRAFDACPKYSADVRGRPRFKRRGEFASIGGKHPASPLQWKHDHVAWGGKRRDRRMVLRPIFDKTDRQAVQAHALSGKIKNLRLLRGKINGEWKLFVQLACEGDPRQRFEVRAQEAGIDLGPSTAAMLAPDRAAQPIRTASMPMEHGSEVNGKQCSHDTTVDYGQRWQNGARDGRTPGLRARAFVEHRAARLRKQDPKQNS